MEELVAAALDANANALIVQTAWRYDCFCNRALYPRTDAGIAAAPYDPLGEVIEKAHEAGLEVHAWVNVGTMWNLATPHSSPDHVFNAHGLTAAGADRWLNKRSDGKELMGNNAFIDPANPAAVDYIVEAIRSVVREYDVDGINLDYIRYPDYNSTTSHSDWGYSETSIARFQAATGRTDVPEPGDQQFTDWRRSQITNLVRRIYVGIYDVDPTGWSGYSYANVSRTATAGDAATKDAERAALAEALTTGPDAPFATDASVPEMPWKQSRGNVAGALVTDDGAALDQVAVTLTPLTVTGEPITHVSDGSGWFGFVDLTPGRYLVQVDLPAGVVGNPVSVVKVGAGERRTAAFVIKSGLPSP